MTTSNGQATAGDESCSCPVPVANQCTRLTTNADLPMPPMPSTLTTRHRSCSTHSESWACSCSRPQNNEIIRASPQSTRRLDAEPGRAEGTGKVSWANGKTCSSPLFGKPSCGPARAGASCMAFSKAEVKAETEIKRSLGSFARALCTTSSISLASPGICALKEGGGFIACWMAISSVVP